MGPQSRSGRCEEEKNHLLLSEVEHRFLGRPVRNIGAIPTELSRIPALSYAMLYTFPYFNLHTLFNKLPFYVLMDIYSVKIRLLERQSG